MTPLFTAAVFSDTHGNTAPMLEALRSLQPDAIIHLGDFVRDTDCLRAEFPAIPLYSVCGNCDIDTQGMPEVLTVFLGPVKAFLTHGHLHRVRYGRDSLVYAAMESGASLALYGHTHEADYSTLGGVTVVNPGTAGKGRAPTYALLQIYPGGAVHADIRVL